MKIWIIYDSTFGNNKKIANTMGELLKDGNDVFISSAKAVHQEKLAQALPEALIFGGPPRSGKISRVLEKWVNNFSKVLQERGTRLVKVAAWWTYWSAVLKMEVKYNTPMLDPIEAKWKTLAGQVPAGRMLPRVLRVQVEHIKGPLEAGWQEKAAQFVTEFKAL